jgi:hypothetical protein
MKKELATCRAELAAKGAPQHEATRQSLKELEQRVNGLVAHGTTREAPRPDVTSQRLTELEERVNGIAADGAPGLWATMAQLAVERCQDAARLAREAASGVGDASSPSLDHVVAVIHDVVAKELPQLVEEHGGHQWVNYVEKLCVHGKRLTQVEDEARDLRGAVQMMYQRVYPSDVEEGKISEGEHRETVPPVPPEEATRVERSSPVAFNGTREGGRPAVGEPDPCFH